MDCGSPHPWEKAFEDTKPSRGRSPSFPFLKGQPEDASDSCLKDSDYWSTAVLNIILNILKQSGKYYQELGNRQHKDFFAVVNFVRWDNALLLCKKAATFFRNVSCRIIMTWYLRLALEYFTTEKPQEENYHRAVSRFSKMRCYDWLMMSALGRGDAARIGSARETGCQQHIWHPGWSLACQTNVYFAF